ncbi:MAG: hypothetical protein GX548_09835, partial [Lentisphaerae bacterium]|nr:hypothetical protein [Lentisphaerota bacterium]
MIPLTSPISIRLAARRACGLLMLLAAAFRASAVTPETPRPPHVLILSSYHHTYAWTDDIIAGIEESLSSNGTPVMFSHEFLDTKRHAETPAYYELMAGVLEHKLQERPADLLILSDNSAFNFAVTHRERLFSGIPVVFCGINNYTPAMREQLPRSAGVAEHKEMGASIDLMRRLHPRTRSIAIVSDATGTGQIDAALTRNAIEESGLQVIELSGTELTLNELLERVGNLPAHSLVFFCSFWRDRDGLSLPAPKVLARLTVAAPVPVYTHADTFLTGGVLGGVVAHGRHQGNLAGDMARRILHGEDPEAIPVVSRSNIPVFDLQALRRWKIDPRRLPPGALLINPPPPTLFQQHSVLVGVVLSSFVILLGFVAGLAFNIARRRRAEAEREKL